MKKLIKEIDELFEPIPKYSDYEELNSENVSDEVLDKVNEDIKNKTDIYSQRYDKFFTNRWWFGSFGIGKSYQAQRLKNKALVVNWASFLNLQHGRMNGENIPVDTHSVYSLSKDRRPLIIDDFGSVKFSDWNMQVFYTIIEERINNGLSTIIISNFSPQQFLEKIKHIADDNFGRLESRLYLFKFKELIGTDRRKNKNAP